jgi:hypothetical protein
MRFCAIILKFFFLLIYTFLARVTTWCE